MNLDPTLLKIFEGEQQEHVARLRALLDAGLDGTGLSTRAEAEEALRRAHTLKGAARAVGLSPTELLAHGMEALFARMRDGALAPAGAANAALRRALDAIEDVLACVIANRPLPDASEALRQIESLLDSSSAEPQAAEPQPAASRAPAPPPPDQRTDLVRVITRNIDDLVRSSSQVLSAANRETVGASELSALAERIVAVRAEWKRRRQRIAAQLKPLAPAASLAPVLECVNSMEADLDSLVRQARAAGADRRRSTWNLQQLASELYRSACRVRMAPAESVFSGFGTMVRDLAHEEGKQVEFRAEGLDVLADRLVLQALKDPVMHLLRNAVAHGIEPPSKRKAAGKPAAGMVRLWLGARGDRLSVIVEDDGAGLNADSITKTAVLRGLVSEAAAASLSRQDLVRFILQPGFSTAGMVTKLAGRGMGMSVVYSEVTRLQGELTVGPHNGAGTRITLSVPLSVSTQQLLLVACAGRIFGIPCWAVERLRRVRLGEIEDVDGAEAIQTELGPVPLARLSDLLEIPPAADEPVPSQPSGSGWFPSADDSDTEVKPTIPVAVLESGGQRVGTIVDGFLDQREALVKDLGLEGASAGMASGGVALEDGTVAIVLNPAMLLEKFGRSGKVPGLKRAEAETPRKIPSILVVDDSITTRSLEKSMLEAHGYRVRVAVDGIEALEQLRAERPDLVITDVMMPRMDGLQLLDRIKHDRDLAGIPVIMVTSLETREDQERGLSLGADAYIVKQKFNQRELLQIIRQIL